MHLVCCQSTEHNRVRETWCCHLGHRGFHWTMTIRSPLPMRPWDGCLPKVCRAHCKVLPWNILNYDCHRNMKLGWWSSCREQNLCFRISSMFFFWLCSCDVLSPESSSKFQCAALVGGIINDLIRHHAYTFIICMCSTVSTAFHVHLHDMIRTHMPSYLTTTINDFIAHVYTAIITV